MAKVSDNLFGSEASVHTMLRRIATTPVAPMGAGEPDALPIEVVDAEVGAWVDRGYRLVNAIMVSVDINAITMVYVLSK